ncbi:MAG: heterodisulfide reductase-related iron-sulfur binding cluster, partial [Deltaproteobacteria bacterium]
RHYRLWRGGKAEPRFDHVVRRLKELLVYAFLQRRLLNNPFAGLFHTLIFFSFTVLFIGTLVVMVHEDFGLPIMRGNFYLVFQSLTLDVFGALAILGVLIALYHRYLRRPARLHSTWQDGAILGLVLTILLTGFIVEGLRIIATADPWRYWSPVGLATGKFVSGFFPAASFRPAHALLWWLHLLLVFGFIAWIPYSKLLHLFTSPANIYFRSLEAKGGMLKPIDTQTAESFGVNRIDQMSWKALLDLDACTECGRCQDVCPAFNTRKPLSPKSLILDLRESLHADGTAAAAATPLIGNVIAEDTLWSCTTCAACMQECPVFIEHVPKIVDMRRHLVMEEGKFPETMQRALRSLEARGHPFPGASASRIDWYQGLDVKILSEAGPTEYLYWVGCSTALTPRNQKTARNFVRLLQQAGVEFAILGQEERCSGDPARRVGNEYLFETLARKNIELLESREVKKIITTCPHCFNTLKNEYRQFGANFEVFHHTEILAELINEGRLKPLDGLDQRVTYHDPCYLGRYNDTYREPREVLAAIPNARLIEMAQSREKSFCCGAGGGLMWIEEPSDKRVNSKRVEHAFETGANILAVACPFCMTMLEDGVKARTGERELKVMDIAELLDRAAGGSETS